jgi:uracil-DNA glycosylase family protein
MTERVQRAAAKTASRPRQGASASSAYLPEARDVSSLREAAASCRACPLWERATRTVFGEGPEGAHLFLVGEQPGDEEDLAGHPFVGPAGRLLTQILSEAGIDRASAYLSNAVKHFKFEPRGKRRLHSKPGAGEVQACHAWLDAELAAVRPRVVVCLGATAARSLLGAAFSLTRRRGEAVPADAAPVVIATWHPSAILRAPDDDSRTRMRSELLADLTRARIVAGRAHGPGR